MFNSLVLLEAVTCSSLSFYSIVLICSLFPMLSYKYHTCLRPSGQVSSMVFVKTSIYFFPCFWNDNMLYIGLQKPSLQNFVTTLTQPKL